MSIQQAANLLNQQKKKQPIERGLQAGYDAYHNTGTSAAAYDYLMGGGAYPIATVPSGLPIQMPYEEVTGRAPQGTYTPYTQGQLAQQAKDAPYLGTSGSQTPMPNMQPSTAASLASMAMPAYVGYKYLMPAEAKNWIAEKTGIQALGAKTGAAQAGATQAGATQGISAATPSAAVPGYVEPAYTGNYAAAAAPSAAPASSTAGYVYDAGTGSLVPATGAEMAAANAGAGATGAGAVLGDFGAAAGPGGIAEAGAGTAAAGQGLGAWMAANPELAAAAAILSLTPGGQKLTGNIVNGITGVVNKAGDIASSALNTVGNAASKAVSGIGGAIGSAASGVASAARSVTGGIADAIGCFLTTAAVEHMGQPDDGRVLTAFRRFRDTYMMETPERRREVEWYYRKAPKIVMALSKNPRENAIYREMYNKYIIPTYKAIMSGDMEHAHQEYTKLIGFAKKASGLSSKELEMGKSHGIPKNISKNFKEGGTTEEDLLRPQIESTNALGQTLDSDLSNAYQRAVTNKQTKKARTLKDELNYRERMKSYQTPQQAPVQDSVQHFNLGGYSDGGRLLKGPGDGVSDSIPATIGDKRQPARLADGEFVVPARIVSELGNGSTEAGARKLYAMMDRIQAGRKKSVGKGKVAVNSRADKHLPA